MRRTDSRLHPTRQGVTRSFAFGAALLLLGKCGGGGCAPTTPAPTGTTKPAAPATTAPAVPTPSGAKFELLPVGAALPSDADCAARVRRGGAEVRPDNNTANHTVGAVNSTYPRSTGNFTGTTDEIIQWAACKWGFPEDVLRAQVAKESYWHQWAAGDWTSDASICAPGHGIGADGKAGQCPESMGLMQVRTQYFRDSINNAIKSSAYNLDVSLAVWRGCFEGQETWLNQGERGSQYAAGDMWGCIGRWFAGRWHTPAAETYISAVKDLLNQRVWETQSFANG